MQNAILKDCKTVEVPGVGPPKEEDVLTPEPNVIEEAGQADTQAQPSKTD